jgi:hypothetical protein
MRIAKNGHKQGLHLHVRKRSVFILNHLTRCAARQLKRSLISGDPGEKEVLRESQCLFVLNLVVQYQENPRRQHTDGNQIDMIGARSTMRRKVL